MSQQLSDSTFTIDNRVYQYSDLSKEPLDALEAFKIADGVVATNKYQFDISFIGRQKLLDDLLEALKDTPYQETPSEGGE